MITPACLFAGLKKIRIMIKVLLTACCHVRDYSCFTCLPGLFYFILCYFVVVFYVLCFILCYFVILCYFILFFLFWFIMFC